MPGLGLAALLPLLNSLHAGRHAELSATAAGRSTGLVTLTTMTATLAASIADLDEKICPIVGELDRSRTDRRWHQFQAASNAASRHASRVCDTISSAATDALLVVTELEPVRYCGTVTVRHGDYVLAGPCGCNRCRYHGDRLRLCQPFDNVADVTCVRPGSVTAASLQEPPDLPTQAFASVLRDAIATMATPIEPAPAAILVDAMTLLTGRTRVVLSTWSEAVDQRLSGRFITALDGTFAPRHRKAITERIRLAATGLAGVQEQLRDAATTLRAISAGPPRTVVPR